MRVLHLIDSAGVYGAEKMLLALCVEQRRLGVDASVLSVRLPEEAGRAIDVELRRSGVPVISWPMRAGMNFRGMGRIRAWAAEQGVDVLHSHGYKFNVLLAYTLGGARIRKVTTVHGYTWAGLFDRMTLYRVLDRMSHLAFDRVVYVSPALQRRSMVSRRKRSSIPNGIDVSALPLPGTRLEAPSGDAAVRLIAVGRLAAEKDYELLLQAVALLRNRSLSVSLDIFGEGPEESRLRRTIADERLDRVELRGYSSDIATELARHDILVLSSRTEGMPITIIEAMCMGIRIVATRVGGIPALLGDYPLATLAQSRSASNLADAIQAQIANSRSLRQDEVAAIRELLSSSTMASRYAQAYESLFRAS
jgi:glycosyltransferase involved in cell wall biosynthesis